MTQAGARGTASAIWTSLSVAISSWRTPSQQGFWALGECACLVPVPELRRDSSQIAWGKAVMPSDAYANVRGPPRPPWEPGLCISAHWHGHRFTCTDCSAWDEREKAHKKHPIPEVRWLVRNTFLPLKEMSIKLLGVLANTPDVHAELTWTGHLCQTHRKEKGWAAEKEPHSSARPFPGVWEASWHLPVSCSYEVGDWLFTESFLLNKMKLSASKRRFYFFFFFRRRVSF